ncbi:MAG TPA: AIR synthase related protein [Candidatus Cloacimonadota bacterium]|nr:AIR synthase related protein [Candidatus Cloacimonadota bacterium]HPT71235.1 AIR synthase related protein [Candidatus Cloacimonadota bacterium]
MNFEEKVIHLINSVMPKSPLRKSVLGEVDSEVFLLGDNEHLFTTDDFSHEDLLQEDNPNILGWNIACGAISDIIAAGGKPLLYAHSMVIPQEWDEAYVREFSKGISKVLKKYPVSFIGGDLGIGEHWRYTASVIGTPVGKGINRRGCKAGDSIFLTGKIGEGNFQAVMNLFSGNSGIEQLHKGSINKFHTHERLPEIISQYATCAIDTSDGVFSALQTISKLNGTGFQINNLHFQKKCTLAANLLQIPELLFFLGECGEYEILFTVSSRNREYLQAELIKHEIEAYEVGNITGCAETQIVTHQQNHYDFTGYNFKARDYSNIREYVQKMIEWVINKGRIS